MEGLKVGDKVRMKEHPDEVFEIQDLYPKIDVAMVANIKTPRNIIGCSISNLEKIVSAKPKKVKTVSKQKTFSQWL